VVIPFVNSTASATSSTAKQSSTVGRTNTDNRAG
jgi:hypothetical protein